jgi:tRNA pseudouridine55 synthase
VKFKVKVSSGTYIRSLIHDLGQDLKCGAIVSELRRNSIGDFDVKNADIKKMISIDEMMKNLPKKFEKISVNEKEYEALKKGQIVMNKKVEQGEGIAMAFLKDKFIGVVENSKANNGIKFKKMIVF